ncbi:MAG: response regulator [Longimicrobiales bacterium]
MLLVEDDAATRNLIARHLGRDGYTVTAVEAAEEGRVEAGAQSFDVVIADVHLPGESGIDLASDLLSLDATLPIVLVGLLLRNAVPALGLDITVSELAEAARTHEIGWLSGQSGDPTALAVQGSGMLARAGCGRAVVETVRHFYERWDGTGGSGGLRGRGCPRGRNSFL